MITLKKKKFFALSLLLITIISFIVSALPCKNIVNAQTTAYSDVLDDLREDASFNISDFPEQINNCSLSVITIAESKDKELFVYVYQPSGSYRDYRASYINISTDERLQTGEDGNLDYDVYSLIFCNSFNTLFKYKVDDFVVSEDETRYYQIPSIFRPFDETVDKQADFDNKVTDVNFDVCKQYTFTTVDGQVSVLCDDIEFIRVTDKFVGYVRVSGGFFGSAYDEDQDIHFVAFNTDRRVDKLLEADVSFFTQSYSFYYNSLGTYKENYGNIKKQKVYLSCEDEQVKYNGGGFFSKTYLWDTIQKPDEFIASFEKADNLYSGVVFDVSYGSKITEEGKKALKSKAWILNFYSCGVYRSSDSNGLPSFGCTYVGGVTILRLKFETNGVVYNLGVLDNMQTGSSEPINYYGFKISIKNKWKWLLIFIVIIILLIFFWPVMPYIFNFVVWVISLPFKFIASVVKLFKKNKNKKE